MLKKSIQRELEVCVICQSSLPNGIGAKMSEVPGEPERRRVHLFPGSNSKRSLDCQLELFQEIESKTTHGERAKSKQSNVSTSQEVRQEEGRK